MGHKFGVIRVWINDADHAGSSGHYPQSSRPVQIQLVDPTPRGTGDVRELHKTTGAVPYESATIEADPQVTRSIF